MNRLLTALLFLAALPVLADPGTDSLLQQAQNAYAKGDHQRALALYDSVQVHSTSAGLLFNIGNCWSKMGDVPHAILYYERALRLEPGAEDIQANLDMMQAKVVDRMNELPSFTLGSLWDRWLGGKDMDQWARRSLWACAIMALAAGTGLWMRNRAVRRILLAIGAAALLATVASAMLAAYRVEQVGNRSEAIIMAPSAEILGEPRDGATRLFILHQGTKVGILKHQGSWQEVRLSSGAVGWTPASALEVI